MLGETRDRADSRQLVPSWSRGALGEPAGGRGRRQLEAVLGADQLFHQHDIIGHGMDTSCQEANLQT